MRQCGQGGQACFFFHLSFRALSNEAGITYACKVMPAEELLGREVMILTHRIA